MQILGLGSEISYVRHGNKGLENLINVNFDEEKLVLHENGKPALNK